MSMPARDHQWHESYRRISHLLPILTKKELDIIGAVVDEFIENSSVQREILPLSETEIWARIDHSIEQADNGEVMSLEETMAVIDEEFQL